MDQRDLKIAVNSSGIYRITNKVNGSTYVGSAINFKKRWSWHRKDLKAKRHRNKYLQNAWHDYGEDTFIFSILEICAKEKLIEREQYWINSFNCVRPNGYNLAPIAGNSLGIKRSDETKKLQRSLKLGRKLSKEHKEQISLSLKGKVTSEETKRKIGKAHLGNKWGLGFKHSEETKAKMRKPKKPLILTTEPLRI